MAKSIYILSAEPGCGKSLIVLGMMELLSGRARNVGFFRPLTYSEKERDSLFNLIVTRYNPKCSSEEMYGCTYDAAHKLFVGGRYDDLLKLILEKHKNLEKKCDVVLCAGADFAGIATALEFTFNVDVANNLGCLVLPVVRGSERSSREIVDAVWGVLESLEDKRCDLLGVFVNRTPVNEVEEVLARVRQAVPKDMLVTVIPEYAILGKPTVGEIAHSLNARWISKGGEDFDREVSYYKVAAMELSHFLDHIEEGSLIITPGDRSDIILGSLIADASTKYPKVAGILLSGNFMPAPQVQRLIEGLAKSSVPILSVATDTFVTAVNVEAVEGALVPENHRKIAAALGVVEAHMSFPELWNRVSVAHSVRKTPMMFEYDLIQRAKINRQHVVLPEGTEERILRATEMLILRRVVNITLLGNPEEIGRKIASLGLQLKEVNIIDPITSEWRGKYADVYYELRKHKGISREFAFDMMADISYFGTMMVYEGQVDAMVSGSVHTTQHTIRPALETIRTKPGCSIVSSVFFMCLADRVLVFGDCAVNPEPTAEQLADIALSSADTARMFGIEPRVAMLSYSTGNSGKGKEVDKVREATRIARGLRPEMRIEGPIQYDAAIDETVARTKLPGSEVAGHATIFIFPDLNTGNNTYKAVQRSANAVAIGPVLQGLRKPVNDLSRGCTVADIVNTVAITAIQAQETKGQ